MTKLQNFTILISSLLVSGAAFAATQTTTMPITASVAGTCSVSSAGADLGSVNAFGGASTSGSIEVNCSNGISYQVGLGAGLQPQESSSVRSMQSGGGDNIRYAITKGAGTGDPGSLWGDQGLGNGSGNTIPGTVVNGFGTGAAQILGMTVGIVSEGINTYTAGANYSDTVTITVNF